jgi:hypothetical protein
MAIVVAIIGFVTGMSIGSGATLLTLVGRRGRFYWSLVNRRPTIGRLARFSIMLSIIACGVAFAYFRHMLAE